MCMSLMSSLPPTTPPTAFFVYLQILRLQKVNNHLNSIRELSIVLSHDTNKTLTEVHPSLTDPANGQSKSISNDTLARLTGVVNSLNQEKQQRLQKVMLIEV